LLDTCLDRVARPTLAYTASRVPRSRRACSSRHDSLF